MTSGDATARLIGAPPHDGVFRLTVDGKRWAIVRDFAQLVAWESDVGALDLPAKGQIAISSWLNGSTEGALATTAAELRAWAGDPCWLTTCGYCDGSRKADGGDTPCGGCLGSGESSELFRPFVPGSVAGLTLDQRRLARALSVVDGPCSVRSESATTGTQALIVRGATWMLAVCELLQHEPLTTFEPRPERSP